MQHEAHVKFHASLPLDIHEALTSIAAMNKARKKKGDSLSSLLAELGAKHLKKPESVSALRAAGSRHADTFASK
jgi:hypothetical protein